MFHTIITTAYIIPNIYLFLRIWYIFIDKGYKFQYTLIYVFFACIYPVSNLFSDGDQSYLSVILRALGDYILPFYLNLFLVFLVFDIFLIINRFIKVVSSDKLRSKRFRKTALPIIILIPAIIVVAGIINFNTIRTTEYQIEIPAGSSKLASLRIAFVADFHLNEETSIPFVKRFADKIAGIKPDLMLYGGDIVESGREGDNMKVVEQILKTIITPMGTYAVLGNHEHYARQDQGSFFDKSGIKVLIDTVAVIDNSFYLAGRNDSHIRNRKNLQSLLSTVSDSLPLILLDHRPTEISEVSLTNADIQFSGHTHNGQLFPINLITRKVYELSWGYKKVGHTHFFVTSGIRLWGPRVRTTGKSEIMVVDINFTRER